MVENPNGKALVKKEELPKKSGKINTNQIYRMIGEIDRPMLIVIIALVCIGSIMVFSASYAVGETRFDDSYHFARSQVRFVLLGLLFMIGCTRVPYGVLKQFAYIFYAFALVLNYIVPFAGITRNGATRWFNIMGLEFQPSELLKFALVLVLSTYISNNASRIKTWRHGILPIISLTAPACFATILQSHMSATIILLILAVMMLWLITIL